ncbi:hypothetical protein ACGF12_22870 [Kitasatospora sp. NPDC048296]|uniref:hypothetical protein n=1 Tax=Kitasatospora sp. NPDC048296 TaxID=3364048 RepID=UPI0037119798
MSEHENGTPEDLARQRLEVVEVQRKWYAAEAAWTEDSTDRGLYEAFIRVGLELHAHPYWAAAGGNRFEAERDVREAARSDA